MIMGRTKSTAKLDIQPDTPLVDGVAESVKTLAALTAAHSDERDLVNQLLGQAQMADAFEQFSRTVRSSKLAFVKENKLYRALKGKKTPNGSEFLGTWEEFCGVLGMSVDKADQDIANLRAFGEEALESMSRMGIGYRELRQYRRLPEDSKTALIEAAKTGDKDGLLELAEELVAKQISEKEILQKQVTTLTDDLEASRALVADKEQRYEKVFYEREKLKEQISSRVQTEPPDETAAAIRADVSRFAGIVEAEILSRLTAAISALCEHGGEHGINNSDFLAGIVCQIELTIAELREKFDIKQSPNGQAAPDWLTDRIPELDIPAHVRGTMES